MFGAIRERAPGPRLGDEQIAEFRRIRTQQPGYRGIVEVEAEDGRVLILTLWDTAEQAQSAGQAIEAAGRRLGGGQWSGPPPVIGQGQVIYNDLAKP
jgi:hypothetical protein